MADTGIRAVPAADADYPHLLLQIKDPPRTLYVRGDLSCLHAPSLAVVGTRKMTPYGKAVLGELIPPLAAAGITIVSGLALGVDGEAHRQTLLAGGRTAAVLGSGIRPQDVTPVCHSRLAEEIILRGGALVSEYPQGTPSLPYHFPTRNRILSGLCRATLVIEAGIKSGTLITARHALDQGRDVLAVPGDILRESAGGPNLLIGDGARPVTTAADILDALGVGAQHDPDAARPQTPLSDAARALLPHLSREPLHIDALARAAKLPAAVVSETLLVMELRGQVRHLGGQLYRL
ncbi:DNA-protecting protein DprA [Patescibacteria group bacterium]|nr:MAG: DNA-protecting protein DprA [Patescibacteria group bacterium]